MKPKFRAFFIDSREMVDWEELSKFKGLTDIFKYSEDNKLFSLMQATGVTDQEGTEFYDGDIAFDDHTEALGVVVFEEGAFMYQSENVSYYLSEVARDIHIIGNAYENSELLEGK